MTNIAYRNEDAAGAAKPAPQDELERIRTTDRTLAGFIRCLDIIERTGAYRYEQNEPHLEINWLETSKAGGYCAACIGALLAWFFDTEPGENGCYCFSRGEEALIEHLGSSEAELENLLTRFGAAFGAFGSSPWPELPSRVFRRLQERFPDK